MAESSGLRAEHTTMLTGSRRDVVPMLSFAMGEQLICSMCVCTRSIHTQRVCACVCAFFAVVFFFVFYFFFRVFFVFVLVLFFFLLDDRSSHVFLVAWQLARPHGFIDPTYIALATRVSTLYSPIWATSIFHHRPISQVHPLFSISREKLKHRPRCLRYICIHDRYVYTYICIDASVHTYPLSGSLNAFRRPRQQHSHTTSLASLVTTYCYNYFYSFLLFLLRHSHTLSPASASVSYFVTNARDSLFS